MDSIDVDVVVSMFPGFIAFAHSIVGAAETHEPEHGEAMTGDFWADRTIVAGPGMQIPPNTMAMTSGIVMAEFKHEEAVPDGADGYMRAAQTLGKKVAENGDDPGWFRENFDLVLYEIEKSPIG